MRPSAASSWRDLRVLGLFVVMLAIVALDLAVPSAGVLPFLCVPELVVAGFAEQRTTGTGVYQGSWTRSLLTRGWVRGPQSEEVLAAVQG